MRDPVRVVYIMGTARSGSTVLNTVLASHPDCVGVGELMSLTRTESAKPELCSCGRTHDQCEFWSRVLANWSLQCGSASTREYSQLQDRFERIRRWPALLALSHFRSRRFSEYSDLTTALFCEISRASHRPVVVESSKYPIRGYGLSLLSDIDLRIVYIVRDPRGVAWSFKKAFAKDVSAGIPRDLPPRNVFRSAAIWLLTCLQSEFVLSRLVPGRAIRVRYEDLVDEPVKTCRMLATVTGLEWFGLGAYPEREVLHQMPHAIAGNRVRMAKRIDLRADLEWQTGLLGSDRKAVERIARPMMKRYGYLASP